jgi:hypothetical protein
MRVLFLKRLSESFYRLPYYLSWKCGCYWGLAAKKKIFLVPDLLDLPAFVQSGTRIEDRNTSDARPVQYRNKAMQSGILWSDTKLR